MSLQIILLVCLKVRPRFVKLLHTSPVHCSIIAFVLVLVFLIQFLCGIQHLTLHAFIKVHK